MHAARFEQVVGAADVGFERRQRIPQRRRDDRLRAKVEDRVDFVLVDGALQRVVVLEAAVDDAGLR